MKKHPASLRSFASASAMAAALVASSSALQAAGVFTWNGATNGGWATTGNATQTSNWVGNATLTSDNQTDVIFDSSARTLATSGNGSYIGGSRTVRSLTYTSNITSNVATSLNFFNAFGSDLTLSADAGNASLTVNAGATGAISLGAASGVGTAWGALVLSSNLDVIHNGSGQVTFNRAVTGTGGLTKTGTGTLAFTSNATSANTYSGLTTVSGGNLTLAKVANLDAIAGNLLINNSGTVTLSLAGNQIKDTASIEVATGGTFRMVGNATINASETVNGVKLTGGSITSSGNSSITLISTTAFDLQSGNSSARLTGTAGAIKSTSGTVILSGGHTLSGNITVNEGTLQLSGFNTLTGAVLTVNGGALYASASGNATQDIDSASNLNLNGGSLRINPSFAAGSFKNCNTLPVVVSSPSTLSYENGANYSIAFGLGGTAGFALDSNLTVQNNSSNATVTNPINITRNITSTGSLIVNTYNSIGSPSANYSLGRVLLGGNNTAWTGDLVVAKGTASLGGTVTTSSGGAGNIVIGETADSFGAGLILAANSPTVTGLQTISRNLIVRSGGFRSIKGNSDNSYVFTGNVTLEGDLNVDLGLYYLDKYIAFSGDISGPGGVNITKTGGDFIRLSGNNTFTGPTTVTSGLLELRNSATSSLTVAPDAGLRFTLNDGLTPIASTTGSLTLSGNNTVNIFGTPAPSTTYTLITAASISGATPSLVYLSGNVTGYSLVVEGNALKLKADAIADTTPPVISAAAPVSLDWGQSYTDTAPTATDETAPANPAVNTTGSVDTSKPGVYTLTYNAQDTAGNNASPVQRTVTVSILNPTTTGVDGYSPLMKYALGANNPSDTFEVPVTSATATTLAITAAVRIDDPTGLTVTAETNTDLTASGSWTSAGVVVTTDANQVGVPSGCERKVFTVSTVGQAKKFLRLKAVSTP